MSDTPKAADDIMKLLDAGWTVSVFKNGMGSYTAYAYKHKTGRAGSHKSQSSYGLPERQITDDFTPSQVLYRLAEKVTTGRVA